LYVTGGGCASIAAGKSYPPPGHPKSYAFDWSHGRRLADNQILYIAHGAGEFESERSGKQIIEAGSAMFLFSGVWHRYRPIKDLGWDEYYVAYDGEYVRRWIDGGFITPERPILKTGIDETILHGYLNLLERIRLEPSGFEQLLASCAMEILASVLGAVRGKQTGGHANQIVREAKSILEADMDGSLMIEKLVKRLGISATHFFRLFKEHTGLTPYQYHLQLRINRAKELLHGTNMTVKEVARELHFESEFHFSKIFKKKTEYSPSAWRRLASRPEEIK
jgi:AraC-like DNA-binding protein